MKLVYLEQVSTGGLDSSPVLRALAGVREKKAKHYKNKYILDLIFSMANPCSHPPQVVQYVTLLSQG
ncbi:MAG: hypothetical protein ACYDH1_00725 [Anaerolineaceae bacterium]